MTSYNALMLLIFASILSTTVALQCYQCGQFNDGVGSITPCLDYSEKSPQVHLKECPRKTEKFCVKYVSQLSTVRDCVENCVEKEVWDSTTYCCGTDGCNGSPRSIAPSSILTSIMTAICIMAAIRHIKYV